MPSPLSTPPHHHHPKLYVKLALYTYIIQLATEEEASVDVEEKPTQEQADKASQQKVS